MYQNPQAERVTAYPIGTPADLGHLVLSEVGDKISVPTRRGHKFAT